jgi:hypothetical protein
MPRQLRIGLSVEGSTDKRFLPEIIRRLVELILNVSGNSIIDLLDPEIIELENPPRRQADKILMAAKQAVNFDLLIVHTDCDKPNPAEIYRQRILPGFTRVDNARVAGELVCDELVALIPNRMIEAWVIADVNTLIQAIGTDKSPGDLALPVNLARIENIADPKQVLNNAVNKALADSTRRRRKTSDIVGRLYFQMGQEADLSILEQLPSFAKFKSDLEDTFRRMGLIR